MKSSSWVRYLVLGGVAVGALWACGEEDGGGGNEETAPNDPDASIAPDAGMLISRPPDEQLPDLPIDDPDSGAPPGAAFFGRSNPVIYINDGPKASYTDGYMLALAANGEIQLKGMISSGVDCMCPNGDNYPIAMVPETRQMWIDDARASGFQNLPDNTNGTQAPQLLQPPSMVIADTVQIGSPGTDLIIAEAKAATPQVPLLIVAGGPITTLADAYLKDPSITRTTVVSWLAGSLNCPPAADGGVTTDCPSPEVSLEGYNGAQDRWAAQIVLRNFRVFIFPTNLSPPHTPEMRMMDFPESALRTRLLLEAGFFTPNYDADGAPAVTIMFPAYMQKYERRSMTGDLFNLKSQLDPQGNLWLLKEGDQEGGGNEFFRALCKAFKGPYPDGNTCKQYVP